MPKAWSKKDERQYRHVKESEAERGRSPRVAKRIAAATVNKQRSKEGRTASSSSRDASSRRARASRARSRAKRG